MPDEVKTLWVKAAKRDGRQAFWERDRAHPPSAKFPKGGEVDIAAPHPDEPEAAAVEVGDTPVVAAAILEGRLVRADAPKAADAPKPAEARK